jgi:hypothetical protein
LSALSSTQGLQVSPDTAGCKNTAAIGNNDGKPLECIPAADEIPRPDALFVNVDVIGRRLITDIFYPQITPIGADY